MLALLVLMPAVLALAKPLSSHPRSETDAGAPADLLLRYHRDIASNQTELSLSTLDKSHTYSHGCGNSLEVAGRTVSVAVNDRGAGNVLIDAEEYQILGDRQMSGGASCTKLYNDKSVVVECSVPWHANMEDLSAISDDGVEECFSEESAARRRSLPTSFAPSVVSAVEKRQGLCMWFYADNVSISSRTFPNKYIHAQSRQSHFSNNLLRPISLAMATPIKITSISRSAPAKPAPSAAPASSESAKRSPSQSLPRSPASAPGSAAVSASPARYHPPQSAAATVRRVTPSASGAKPTTPLTR